MANILTFNTLVAGLLVAHEEINAAVVKGLKKSAIQVRNTAKSKFGEYQPAYGPYNGWAVLNRDYVIRKVSAGSAGDDPLIGHYFTQSERASRDASAGTSTPLRNSIQYQVDDLLLEAVVGTNNKLGIYHEYGAMDRATPLPPRPWLRPALYQNVDWIRNTMLEALTEMRLFR